MSLEVLQSMGITKSWTQLSNWATTRKVPMTDYFLFVLPDTLPPFSTQYGALDFSLYRLHHFIPCLLAFYSVNPTGLMAWEALDAGQRSNESINDNGVFLGLIILASLDTGEVLQVSWVCLQQPILWLSSRTTTIPLRAEMLPSLSSQF